MTPLTPLEATPWAWSVLRGPLTPDQIERETRAVAKCHHLHPTRTPDGFLLTQSEHEPDPLLRLSWRHHPPPSPDTLTHTVPGEQVEILLHYPAGAPGAAGLTR